MDRSVAIGSGYPLDDKIAGLLPTASLPSPLMKRCSWELPALQADHGTSKPSAATSRARTSTVLAIPPICHTYNPLGKSAGTWLTFPFHAFSANSSVRRNDAQLYGSSSRRSRRYARTSRTRAQQHQTPPGARWSWAEGSTSYQPTARSAQLPRDFPHRTIHAVPSPLPHLLCLQRSLLLDGSRQPTVACQLDARKPM